MPQRTRPIRPSNRSTGAGSGLNLRPLRSSSVQQVAPKRSTARPRQSRATTPPDIYDNGLRIVEVDERVKAYIEEKREQRAVELLKAHVYQPPKVTIDALNEMGPGLALGKWGMEGCVVDWMKAIENKVEKGSKIEPLEVLPLLLEAPKEAKVDERGVTDGDEVGERLRETFERTLAQKVFQGRYELGGRRERDVLDSLRRQAVRNPSYDPRSSASLLDKVGSMLPVERSTGGQAMRA